jgi:methylisocitrate lyase
MVFPEAVQTLAQYSEFRRAVGVPVLANITEFGHTPLFTTAELGEAGVDIVLYCCSAYRAMNRAALTVYEGLKRDGHQRELLDLMQTREELYHYLGYHDYERKLDELFARDEDANDG